MSSSTIAESIAARTEHARAFSYDGRILRYNRVPFNHVTERAVEIPIAFDFLARLERRTPLLEVGHVLGHYENALSDHAGIRPRRVIDKFERDLDVENADVMDLPGDERYAAIVSVSTVEHVGQGVDPGGGYGERGEARDREAPLAAIAKIYSLLDEGGLGLVTVPYGRLTDGGWYVQFGHEYLERLFSRYGVPRARVRARFLRRTWIEPGAANPLQAWEECSGADLARTEYHDPWPAASGVLVLEMTGEARPAVELSPARAPDEDLDYGRPALISGPYHGGFVLPAAPAADGTIRSSGAGFLFHGPYVPVAAGRYVLQAEIDVTATAPCDLLLEAASGTGSQVHASVPLRGPLDGAVPLALDRPVADFELRLGNRSGSPVDVTVRRLALRRA